MAKKRVFLDECCGDHDFKSCFPLKSHVYVTADFGIRGREDTTVIDHAVRRGCLIVTVNKDFLDYYRNHRLRKGRNVTWFYGLILLKPSNVMTRREQLQAALRDFARDETRQHDDLVIVSAEGLGTTGNVSSLRTQPPQDEYLQYAARNLADFSGLHELRYPG